jgi:hypothetical protein
LLHFEDDVPAAAAVPAVRSAPGHILFPPKRDGSPSAVSGAYFYNGLVYKTDHERVTGFTLSGYGLHTCQLSSPADMKNHCSVLCSKKSIVLAFAYVVARMNFRSSLPDDDRAGSNESTVGPFDTEALGLRISAVSGAPSAFFMGHVSTLLW